MHQILKRSGWLAGYASGSTGCAYTQNNDEEKVNIGNIVELEEQIFGNKAQCRVLCRSDLVPDELLLVVALFIQFSRRKGNVHIDVSRAGAGLFLLLSHWTIPRDIPILIVTRGLFFVTGDANFGHSVEN